MCCGLAGSINNTTNKLRRRAGKIVGSVKITNPLKKDFVCSCNVFEKEKINLRDTFDHAPTGVK